MAQRHLQWGPVALGQTVRLRGAASLRHEAALKGLALDARVDGPPPVLAGDERLLQMLVMNLVENALKFSHPGRPVEVELAGGDGGAVLRVKDEGIGISPRAPRPHLREVLHGGRRARPRRAAAPASGSTSRGRWSPSTTAPSRWRARPASGTRFEVRLPRPAAGSAGDERPPARRVHGRGGGGEPGDPRSGGQAALRARGRSRGTTPSHRGSITCRGPPLRKRLYVRWLSLTGGRLP